MIVGEVFTLFNILMCLCGVIIGIIFGCIPGMTTSMGIVLFLPFTYSMSANASFGLLLGIYCGGCFGGSISAVLINTPGTGAAAATVLDGYPMAKRGEASQAISSAAIASFFGGVVSCLALMFLSPQLARLGLKFGPAEYFAIGLFGISCVSSISSESVIKGFLGALLGLTFSFVGIDAITGADRFAFKNINLFSGINTSCAMLGIFAISEAFTKLVSEKSGEKHQAIELSKAGIVPFNIVCKNWFNMLRSAVIGTVVGIIPGTGVGVASWLSYNEAKRSSKNPEKFGTGAYEGIFAPEAANNAVTGGALVPLLTLGIPGDVVTAILLGALLIQGITPGPKLFTDHTDVVFGIYSMLLISNVFMLLLGLFTSKYFAKILKLSPKVLVPLIIMFCCVGAYSTSNSTFAIGVVLVMGIIGFLLRKGSIPIPPVLLGLLLGPIIETNYRRAIALSQGSLSIFFTSPISCIIIMVSLIMFFYPLANNIVKLIRSKGTR